MFNVLKDISHGFSTHPVFTSTYGSLSNRDFVKAIYINVLGKEGDAKGIDYWASLLDGTNTTPVSRSDMVANFVNASLTLILTPQNFPTLSSDDLATAKQRQDLITNKVNVAIDFVKTLGEKTNVTDVLHPENDPAYQASVRIISKVTSDVSTVKSATDFLDNIKSDSDSVAKILSEWGNYERLKKTGETESSYMVMMGIFNKVQIYLIQII